MIICKWSGPYLWGKVGLNGLGLTDDGLFCVLDVIYNTQGKPYSKEYFIKADPKWLEAFNKIERGLKPDWKKCSCGAEVVMGNSWDDHTPLCDRILLTSPFEPKNNDGFMYCYKCSGKTRAAGGGQYTVCANKNCEWFDK